MYIDGVGNLVYDSKMEIIWNAIKVSMVWLSLNFALPFHSHDREQASTSHHKSQSIYIPPAKRIDTRSSDSYSGDRSDHREWRSREHDERDSGRGRHRRHGRRGGGHGGRYRAHMEPDYVRNPSKWTKYDLKEDGSQVLRGMSQDQVNKYAAFQFLDEIKKRKSSSSLTTHGNETDNIESDNSSETTKVVFKKPSRSASRTGKHSRTRSRDGVKSEDEDLKMRGQEGHGASGGEGIKMAEYVVGSKAAAQLQRERRQKRAKLVSLHSEVLEEEGGEREDVGDMDSGCDRDVTESGGGSETVTKGVKTVKMRTGSTIAISLSHLEEEDEDT